MLIPILKTYLKWRKKHHLLSFLEGLLHLGRPSAVFFPPELVEQGLGILLSGLNNTLAIQSNPDWIWPFWLERQQDPEAKEFIPTGVQLMTANLSRRNWTSLGAPSSRRQGMLDPVGMLTLFPFGWSVMPYLRIEGESFYPPRLTCETRQYLEKGILPMIHTEYSVSNDVTWSTKALAFEAEGEELIAFFQEFQNLSDRCIALTAGFSIRPYNPLTIGHINKLNFKNRLWRVNRKPGLLFLDEPDRVHVSDRYQGDPVFFSERPTGATRGLSNSGILAGTAEFDLSLKPGERGTVSSFGTLAKVSRRPNLKFKNLTEPLLRSAVEDTLSYWKDHAGRGMTIDLPDKITERAFYAVKNHLHVFDDQRFFSPGAFFYQGHWIRDGAFLALAFENMGFSEDVSSKIDWYLDAQTSEGFFKSQTGEWDSNGQAMVTMVRHFRRTGDPALLERCFPALIKGARWIEEMRSTNKTAAVPHRGLLPAGISAEHFGPNDHYYWDNFWSLAGIRETIWAANKLGRKRESDRLTDAFDGYLHDVTASMTAAVKRVGGGRLPCSPYRGMDTAAIGNLVAVSPLCLFPTDTAWVTPTTDYLWDRNLRDGLFFQKIIHTGLNPYLSVQLAKTLLRLGDPRFLTILKALIAHALPTFTWPEAIHPGTGGGCMGDGDHGWAAAEFLCLVRDMLVAEEQGALLLGSGIPCEWYRPGMRVSAKNAPTDYGRISYSLTMEAGVLSLEWEINRNPFQDPVPLFFLLPAGWYGTEAETVEPLNTPVPNDRVRRVHLDANRGRLTFRLLPRRDGPPSGADINDYQYPEQRRSVP